MAEVVRTHEHTSILQSEAGQEVSRQEATSAAIAAHRSRTVAP